MKLPQVFNCFSLVFCAALFSTSTHANQSLADANQNFSIQHEHFDANLNNPAAQTAELPPTKSANDLTNTPLTSQATADVVSTQDSWTLAKIQVPEQPSPLLFLVGIAVIGLVHLRNKTAH